jgi:hypothetical protein
MPTTQLPANAAQTLLDYDPGICRCGAGYAFGASTTRAQYTAKEQFRVTPTEATRC